MNSLPPVMRHRAAPLLGLDAGLAVAAGLK